MSDFRPTAESVLAWLDQLSEEEQRSTEVRRIVATCGRFASAYRLTHGAGRSPGPTPKGETLTRRAGWRKRQRQQASL